MRKTLARLLLAAALAAVAGAIYLALAPGSRAPAPPASAPPAAAVAAAQRRIDAALLPPRSAPRPRAARSSDSRTRRVAAPVAAPSHGRPAADKRPERAAPPPGAARPGAPMVVSFDQGDVNTLLAGSGAARSRLRGMGVSAVQVAFAAPDRVTVTGWLAAGKGVRQVAVSGRLLPGGAGGVVYRADSGRIGLLPLPVAAGRDVIDRQVQKAIDAALPRLPLVVRGVAVAGTRLRLSGTRKPGA